MTERLIKIHPDKSFFSDEKVSSASLTAFVSADGSVSVIRKNEPLQLKLVDEQDWLLLKIKQGDVVEYLLLFSASPLGEEAALGAFDNQLIIDGEPPLATLMAIGREGKSLESLEWRWDIGDLPELPVFRPPKFLNVLMLTGQLLENLDGLSNLSRLTSLELFACDSLIGLDGISSLTGLRKLILSMCISLTNVNDLSNLRGLTSLDLLACEYLTHVDGLSELSGLASLSLSECRSLESVDGLSSLIGLTSLKLVQCRSLKNVNGLSTLTKLISLDLDGCRNLASVDCLSNLTRLTSLKLSRCISLTNVDGLSNLTGLTSLNLYSCRSLTNVDGLSNLTELTSLNLVGCISLTNLDVLSNLTGLTSLALVDCNSSSSLNALSHFKSLTTLKLVSFDSSSSLDVLSSLTSLTSLELFACNSLVDVDILSNLTGLTSLKLDGCRSLTNIDALSTLAGLTNLSFSGCRYIKDLTSLIHCLSLEKLEFDHVPQKIEVLSDNFRINKRSDILQEKTEGFLDELRTIPGREIALEALCQAFTIIDDPDWVVEKIEHLLEVSHGVSSKKLLCASLETLSQLPFTDAIARLIDKALITENQSDQELVQKILGALPVFHQFPSESRQWLFSLVDCLLQPAKEGSFPLGEAALPIIGFYVRMNQERELDFWVDTIMSSNKSISVQDDVLLLLVEEKLSRKNEAETLHLGGQLKTDAARKQFVATLFDYYCEHQPERASEVFKTLTSPISTVPDLRTNGDT